MNIDDRTPDRDVTDALRRLDRARPATPAELQALAHRITAKAAPLLDDRAHRTNWWEYPAAWARTLIPLGVATALVAVACLLWAGIARLPSSHRPATMTETDAMMSQGLLYSLVEPVEQHVTPVAPRREQR